MHSKIRQIEYSCDEVVIGSSLEALSYSYINGCKFVHCRFSPPWRFDYFKPSDDLSLFSIEGQRLEQSSPLGARYVGVPKDFLWQRLYFHMSLQGQSLLPSPAASIRIEGNTIKAITHNARMAKVDFKKVTVFDMHNVYGIDCLTGEKTSSIFEVRDWFHVKSGMKHEFDFIDGTDNFVNNIIFYPSERSTMNTSFKDAVSVSYLTNQQLSDYDYSDISARFKALHMMKSAGIRGARNGRDQKDKTRYKYYAVRIENTRRDIIPPMEKLKSEHENISFNYDSFYDIISGIGAPKLNAARII